MATLEPCSIEHIPTVERHGHSRQLLWLWLAANLTIADYALGFLPAALGLPFVPALIALALGNVLGGLLLAWSAEIARPPAIPRYSSAAGRSDGLAAMCAPG